MKQMELKALIRAKKAYRHPAMGEISEHLLKRLFTAEKPNEKWLTDVTELKGKDGKLYLAVLKTECFYNAGELTVGELMKQIDDYMDYYNRERCSLKLKKLSPVAYRIQLAQSA